MDLKLFTACLLVVVSYAAAKSTHREYIDLTVSNICIAKLCSMVNYYAFTFVNSFKALTANLPHSICIFYNLMNHVCSKKLILFCSNV